MAMCLTENVALYKIDVKDGKLIELLKFQADFSEEYPSVNHCALSYDTQAPLLATGGDDKILRIYSIAKDFKSIENKTEFPLSEQPITCIDMNRDNSVMVVTSKDSFAYMIDIQN